MLKTIADAIQRHTSPAYGIDLSQLNKSYILLVNQLNLLYARTSELKNIEPDPAWLHFDILEGAEWDINQHIHQYNNDAGYNHIAQINRLCIIAGIEEPDITPTIKAILDEADAAIAVYDAELNKRISQEVETTRDWYIPEYTLTYKPDGTILVNEVLKLKKTQAGSAPDKLLSQAIENPNKLFKPDIGHTTRNLSTILSSMGFSGTLRSLFFPSVNKVKGIIFRPVVSNDTAKADRINTNDLDTLLKKKGAKTKTHEISLDDIPF